MIFTLKVSAYLNGSAALSISRAKVEVPDALVFSKADRDFVVGWAVYVIVVRAKLADDCVCSARIYNLACNIELISFVQFLLNNIYPMVVFAILKTF